MLTGEERLLLDLDVLCELIELLHEALAFFTEALHLMLKSGILGLLRVLVLRLELRDSPFQIIDLLALKGVIVLEVLDQ